VTVRIDARQRQPLLSDAVPTAATAQARADNTNHCCNQRGKTHHDRMRLHALRNEQRNVSSATITVRPAARYTRQAAQPLSRKIAANNDTGHSYSTRYQRAWRVLSRRIAAHYEPPDNGGRCCNGRCGIACTHTVTNSFYLRYCDTYMRTAPLAATTHHSTNHCHHSTAPLTATDIPTIQTGNRRHAKGSRPLTRTLSQQQATNRKVPYVATSVATYGRWKRWTWGERYGLTRIYT
jgi:hypothetical protein